MSYGNRVEVREPFDSAVAAVRQALADQGFGVLTEIDVQATMKAKLDVDMPAYLILGACNPPLAHRALQAEPSVGLLLPCNVTVRQADDGRVLIDALDPGMMVSATDNPALAPIAEEAAQRLEAALAAVVARAPDSTQEGSA